MSKSVKLNKGIAVFPKDTDIKTALSFTERKLPKGRVWYIMTERCGDSLQIAKYHPHNTADLEKITNIIFEKYKEKLPKDILVHLENITVTGNSKFVFVQNIPDISINKETLLSIIMEDLVSILGCTKSEEDNTNI